MNNKIISYSILYWLFLIVLGTYAVIFTIPLRLDHLLFPFLGMGILIYSIYKYKKFEFSNVLYWYLAFLAIAVTGTIIAISSGQHFIRLVPLLSAVESHLRILLIFLVVAALCKHENIDFSLIIKGLILISIILSIFGFLQVSRHPQVLHDLARNITLYCYSGRSDRGVSIAGLLTGIRAVSTFYMPGNFGLFCSLIISFMLIGKRSLNFHYLIYYPVLFLTILGLFFSGSKAVFSSLFVLMSYFIITRKWKVIISVIVGIALSLSIAGLFSEHLLSGYKTYVNQKSFISFYNKFLGKRFGAFAKEQNNGTIKNPSDLCNKNSGKDIQYKFEPGNLNKTFEVIYKNLFFGVGYVSDVNYGDSMIIHLLVRGGVTGFLLYLIFLYKLCLLIYKRNKDEPLMCEYSNAWIVSCAIFIVAGIAFPSFVQDRTGDVFWCLGALLLCMNNEFNNKKL